MTSELIKIKTETKWTLDKLKHPGQTYDGVIQEILKKLGLHKSDCVK